MRVDDGKIVIGVVIISAWLASETHASERSELCVHIGFKMDMEINEFRGDVEALHFQHLQDYSFAMLALIKRRVVILNVNLVRQIRFAPVGEVSWSFATVFVDMRWTILLVKETLIFLDWTESEDDIIMHQC